MVDVNSVGSAGSGTWLQFLKEIKNEKPQVEEVISDITSLSDDTNLVYSTIDSSVNNSTNNSRINDISLMDCQTNSISNRNSSSYLSSSQIKDLRNSWIFNEYPDISVFSYENNVRKSSFSQSAPNTPLIGSANSNKEENGYLRKLALKKNRFSMENQDYNTSLKLKMASDEIDKLIFFLNTPRENEDCTIDSEKYNNNKKNNNIQKLSILEEEEDQLPIIEQRDFKRISMGLENINQNIIGDNLEGFIDISETFMKMKENDFVNINQDGANKITDEKTINGKNQQENNFLGKIEIIKQDHLFINNEIKMDPLIEISIESDVLEECPICCLDIEGLHNVFTFSPCQHRYCVDCIRKYFTDLIFRQMEIQCPDPKCDSIVHDLKIKDLVGNVIYKRFEVYKYFKNTKTDNIIFCAECQNPIPYKSLATMSSTPSKNTVSCDSCKAEHCIECFTLSHPDKNCKENQKCIRESLSPDDLKTINCFLCLEPHDHNLSMHVHGPKYQEENPVLLDNLNYVNRYQKRKKAKTIAKNVLIAGGVIVAAPICVAAAAVAAVPLLIYVLAKKNKKKKKDKQNMKYEEWASNEFKRRAQNGLEISPYIEQAAINYAQRKNKK
ncbi:hypothetical protein DICPUDRAFT_97421 [Dictyostelium purpureum]|uniref:RBR-type E3 ubiquitin transferase n=1 Tax=Dictyostelium purpureum TaxID=5786 RepID=F0ZGK5_DICPU|nr:uncharacterized protein DICPUDRAFT_97421 [Dictyostelium purpureum]EGC36903.1 hypothetical protein DICPUDRAFT_97421 [Dictyostelium purpureum]|eukprot:XP_003286546.1 hypothetical protein DICPUDRAFT_97421 [Dictyostelium purpureum]